MAIDCCNDVTSQQNWYFHLKFHNTFLDFQYDNDFDQSSAKSIIIMIIIIISIHVFIEDNIFSTTASLPYSPLAYTDIDYFRTFFCYYLDFFILDMRC